MARPEDTPVAKMNDASIEAILAAGGVSEETAQMHVHEEMNHLCITLVGTADPEEVQGFAMFCDMSG